MTNKEYILFYDSGIGGLTTLAECIKLLPNENYLYFADKKHCPYGEKDEETIRNLVTNNIALLCAKYNFKSVVIACNTATSVAVEQLRQSCSVPVIGIEPNISEPIKMGFNQVVVLATACTIHGKKLLTLEQKHNVKFKNVSVKNLATLTEQYYHTKNLTLQKKIKSTIRKKLLSVPKKSAVVLGCTHYVFHKSYIEKLGFVCFDGNAGVARMLAEKIKQNPTTKKQKNIPTFLSSPTLKQDLKLKKIFLSITRTLTK